MVEMSSQDNLCPALIQTFFSFPRLPPLGQFSISISIIKTLGESVPSGKDDINLLRG